MKETTKTHLNNKRKVFFRKKQKIKVIKFEFTPLTLARRDIIRKMMKFNKIITKKLLLLLFILHKTDRYVEFWLTML